ncbi:Transposon Ty3-I Gag-Pol polyprotein [Araneus ventricosus]|uniref:RNA-directed DNA polymerase n=1 Tax=Araneus ventricosus TaxID=182803 RepID=A0A4Y2LFS2_ARAVE|nr:Transposon Ty3-I Gag-Pol polyprotein [Araneus ventricosus]GBN13641.1 Transposon Ty3-I Gag-Pol polyprotein [Araneus ventricosus]GBN13684.1 Transposon Ty3-I Gag-Pol polyprotein [Araneus ventricosus]
MSTSLQLESKTTRKSGKLKSAVSSATNSAAENEKECCKFRLFVRDRRSNLRFLVDSGADVSIIPATSQNKKKANYLLYAANGTEISTYGIKMLNLDLGLRRHFQFPFIIADVTKGILGADFLHKYNLLVDINKKKLIDGITNLFVLGDITAISNDNVISILNKSIKISNLLLKYPEISRPNLVPKEIKHDVKHFIETNGQPIHAKARQLDPKRLAIAKEEFTFMLNNEIIRPSNSQWSSPLHLATKKDGSYRPCGDYRQLNAQTIPDRYPIPRLEDFHQILKETKIFSKIDLFKAYFQIPIAEEHKCKTAIITPFGLYEFNVMSFGLKNAPATFQRFIHEVLRGLDFVFPYLDDILIASKSNQEHEIHLNLVLERLNTFGLRINISKSVFAVEEIEFLGYLITPQGSRPLPDKVQAIMNYKRPENIQDLRTFLGILNFYRRYLKDAAKNQALLHEYLKCSKKKDKRKIQWSDEADKQFEKCKNDLANATLLSFPNSELPLSLFTDASDTAIGAVLQQYENSTWKPIAFYYKKLNDTQQNYSTYDRELLGIYLSVKHFKHYLEGRTFTIYTDHKPLTFAFHQKLDKAAPRKARQLNYISQFSTDIKYIKGENNIVADTLSRVTEVSSIDYDQIGDAQTQDEELKSLQTITSLNLKEYLLPSGKYLWCDTSTSKIRPYIPQAFRKQIFHHIHGLSHPGIKSTIKLMNSKFIWLSIKKDVQLWTRTCIPCQKAKINRHTKTKLGEFEVPSGRFCVVHIDLIGPLPPSRGNIYCLTCIDRFSNWMEAIPLDNISADTVARAFYSNWIARFGTPHKLITDRGTQFRSETLQTLSKICGIKLQHTTAYHPACNGKVERLHRTLKTALKAHNNLSWIDTLPTVLLGLRTAIQEDNNHSIAQIVCGESLRLPGEFFSEPSIRTASEGFANNLQKQMETVGPRTTRRNSSRRIFVNKDLENCSHVFQRIDRVKKQLESPYEGPFPVIERQDKYFTINIKGKNVNVSLDRLKPAYILAEDNSKATTTDHIKLQTSDNKPDLTQKQSRTGRTIRLPVRFKD